MFVSHTELEELCGIFLGAVNQNASLSVNTQVKEMIPDMMLAQRCWVAISKEDPAAVAEVLEAMKEKKMAPWYAHLSNLHPALFQPDEDLLAEMKATNEAESERISKVREEGSSPPEGLNTTNAVPGNRVQLMTFDGVTAVHPTRCAFVVSCTVNILWVRYVLIVTARG